MSYDVKLVAHCLWDIALKDMGYPNLTNFRMQKLLYLAHGYYLAMEKRPFITQNFYAWQHGPVIPELYQIYKPYMGEVITENTIITEDLGKLKKADEKYLTRFWKGFKKLTISQLYAHTHRENSPWDLFYTKQKNSIIDNDIIEAYYARELERMDKNAKN